MPSKGVGVGASSKAFAEYKRRKGGVGRLAVNAVGYQGLDAPAEVLSHSFVSESPDTPPAAFGVLHIYIPAGGSPASALCVGHGRLKESHLATYLSLRCPS